ncbi:MAG: hypothetical protein KF866_11110 [Phycisphaeraceae bacterium]|nr:hypothetical protein [Phycisphaeraceae bacterium]MCW5754275.1 hypothetical protein [Phycisphaeraceae bacterium]
MHNRRNHALIVLNAVLVLGLAVLALSPEAGAGGAQPGATGRPRGDYTMVAGQLNFGNSSSVWIVDSSNQEIVTLRWDEPRRNFEGIGYRNIAEDAAARPGR